MPLVRLNVRTALAGLQNPAAEAVGPGQIVELRTAEPDHVRGLADTIGQLFKIVLVGRRLLRPEPAHGVIDGVADAGPDVLESLLHVRRADEYATGHVGVADVAIGRIFLQDDNVGTSVRGLNGRYGSAAATDPHEIGRA